MSTYFYTDIIKRRNKLFVRGYSNGKRFQDEIEYQPFLFVPHKDGEFRSLQGQPLKRKLFGSMSEASDFAKDSAGVSNFAVHGNTNFLYQFINEEFLRDGTIPYDASLIKTVYIDIEVASDKGFPDIREASKEVTAIGLLLGEKTITFGCKAYSPKSKKDIYILCQDERDLLLKFLDCWESEEWSPDVLSGWNIDGFDIPYMYNRILHLLGEKHAKRLSPYGYVIEREVEWTKGKTRLEYTIQGIQVLDYLNIYKKFSFGNQESYKLDHICHVELGEGKVDYSEYRDLLELYHKDYEKFIDYNIKDNRLVQKLEAKKQFINQILFFAYDARVNYVDTLTTVRVWDVITTNYLYDKRIAVPHFSPTEGPKIMGGHVKEPKIGLSKWVITFDYTSLYPHLIMGWNISPDRFVKMLDMPIDTDKFSGDRTISEKMTREAYPNHMDFLKKKNYTMCPNGAVFDRSSQGFLAALMESMYLDRLAAQKKLKAAKAQYKKTPTPELANEIDALDNLQKARKIQLNAAYGALANKYFRFYSPQVAEAVTSIGQFAIQFSERRLNEYMNKVLKTKDIDYIIAIDTDSVHITFDKLVEQVGLKDASDEKIRDFLYKVCTEKFEPFLVQIYNEFKDVTNAFEQRLHMKLETISNKAIWRGKKMYILNVLQEGSVANEHPQLLMHGIEAVRSSTPGICRVKIKEALNIIMNGTEKEYQKFIKDFKNEFWELPFEDIAFPRGANNLEEYADGHSIYRKGTPIQVKGALIYNDMLKKLGLTDRYEEIYNGSKIKFAYLTTPNPSKSTVIATPGLLPPEFKLEKYINRDMQFTKTFLSPIQSISQLAEWKTSHVNTLEDLIQ
jgi:DNA polymerase elongation subunit (family B)